MTFFGDFADSLHVDILKFFFKGFFQAPSIFSGRFTTGEPYQHLGNHLEISTPSRGAVIIAPGQQDARNRSRKKNAGAKSSKNKERGRGGDAFTHSPLNSNIIRSIFKQDYWWLVILPRRRGNTSIKIVGSGDNVFAMHILLWFIIWDDASPYWSSNWAHFATRLFMLHTPALTISWRSARVYGFALPSADQLQLMQHFAEAFNFWSSKQV